MNKIFHCRSVQNFLSFKRYELSPKFKNCSSIFMWKIVNLRLRTIGIQVNSDLKTSLNGVRIRNVLHIRFLDIYTPTELFLLYTYQLHVVIPSPVSILEVPNGIVVRQNSDGIARGKGMDLSKKVACWGFLTLHYL